MKRRPSRGMIVSDWDWTILDRPGQGYCPEPMVDVGRHERVSALLGPDGEPLRVPYERHALGFQPRRKP